MVKLCCTVWVLAAHCDLSLILILTLFFTLYFLDFYLVDILLSVLLPLILKFQVDNFIHADMHPGNILVRVNQKKAPSKGLFKSRPHVVFLDVGMTAELSKTDRVNLLEFFKAVALRDGRTAAERTLRLSKQQNCPNPTAFIKVRYDIVT